MITILACALFLRLVKIASHCINIIYNFSVLPALLFHSVVTIYIYIYICCIDSDSVGELDGWYARVCY